VSSANPHKKKSKPRPSEQSQACRPATVLAPNACPALRHLQTDIYPPNRGSNNHGAADKYIGRYSAKDKPQFHGTIFLWKPMFSFRYRPRRDRGRSDYITQAQTMKISKAPARGKYIIQLVLFDDGPKTQTARDSSARDIGSPHCRSERKNLGLRHGSPHQGELIIWKPTPDHDPVYTLLTNNRIYRGSALHRDLIE